MADTETDKLGLIQIIPSKGMMGFFAPITPVSANFSIEVFRHAKHLGSILSKDVAFQGSLIKLGVRERDTLCRVDLATKSLTLKGRFATADHYAPGYEVVVEIRVTNPSQFALYYLQERDPVKDVQLVLEGELQRYASRCLHDQLKSDELRYRAEHALDAGYHENTGLGVVHVHKAEIYIDPHKRENIVKLHQTSVITQEAIEEITREREYDLLRDREKHLQEYRNRVVKEDDESIDELLINQIHDQLAAGYSLEEIYVKHPVLQEIFASLPPLETVKQATKEDQGEESPSTNEQEQRPLEQ